MADAKYGDVAQYLKTVGPPTLVVAAFVGGTVWSSLNGTIKAHEESIAGLRRDVEKAATASAVDELRHELKTLTQVSEERNRNRIAELTRISERLGGLQDRLGSVHNRRIDVRPTMPSPHVHPGAF